MGTTSVSGGSGGTGKKRAALSSMTTGELRTSSCPALPQLGSQDGSATQIAAARHAVQSNALVFRNTSSACHAGGAHDAALPSLLTRLSTPARFCGRISVSGLRHLQCPTMTLAIPQQMEPQQRNLTRCNTAQNLNQNSKRSPKGISLPRLVLNYEQSLAQRRGLSLTPIIVVKSQISTVQGTREKTENPNRKLAISSAWIDEFDKKAADSPHRLEDNQHLCCEGRVQQHKLQKNFQNMPPLMKLRENINFLKEAWPVACNDILPEPSHRSREKKLHLWREVQASQELRRKYVRKTTLPESSSNVLDEDNSLDHKDICEYQLTLQALGYTEEQVMLPLKSSPCVASSL